MRRVLALTALLALTLPAPADAAVAVVQIQPGAAISTPIGGCTLNFVYKDQFDVTYIGTAGHCANVGHRINSGDGTEFGTVVFSENAYPVNDFALIKIDEEDLDLVSPAMRYWGGPTGLFTFGEGARNDTLLAYGYGIGYGTTEYTRRRIGLLQTTHPQKYTAALNCIFGDSGGPVVHGPTGKALGVIDVLAAPGTGGVLIQNALGRVRYFLGLELTVQTAPLEPIPQV